MARRTWSRSRLLAAAILAGIAIASCGPPRAPARSLDPNADVIVPYTVAGGGTIRFTVHPRYRAGEPVSVAVDLIAGSEQIRGPLAGRVLASGVEGERVARMLGPASLEAVDVAPNLTGHTTVTWDGRDDRGEPLPADTYSLALDFLVGGTSVRFGSVVQIVAR